MNEIRITDKISYVEDDDGNDFFGFCTCVEAKKML